VNLRFLLPFAAVLALTGCGSSGKVQNEAAVRQGVIDYLSKRSDLALSQLDVNVSAVSFRENEADATVTIAPKGGATQGMQIKYTLERQGNRWVVKGRGRGQEAHGGGMPGGMGQMPPNHPPTGAAPQAGQTMPPNHPPMGGEAKK
jgi:hypothetical protein